MRNTAEIMKMWLIVLCTLCTHQAMAQGVKPCTTSGKDSAAVNAVPRLYNLNMPVAPDHYTSGFGFFCKQELKLEKINVPLKFRVGNPEDCNYLESKPHATVPSK